jgi:hypothetical protein
MLCDSDGSRAATGQLLAARPWYSETGAQLLRVNYHLHLSGLHNSQSNSVLPKYGQH